jgi:hypothetical protein
VVAGKPCDPAKMDSGVVASIDAGVAEAREARRRWRMRAAVVPSGPAGVRWRLKRSISAGFDLHRVARNTGSKPIAGDGGGDPFEKGREIPARLSARPAAVDGFWSLKMISVPVVRYYDSQSLRDRQSDSGIEEERQRLGRDRSSTRDTGAGARINWLPTPDTGFR